ncbi:UreD urease accessory protein-domain-containing protein [Pavlovales sp. CCMP2436]|nr:UreD urease accessory protein-domain-containing protein [Pavlovales sp. CCMP2436]
MAWSVGSHGQASVVAAVVGPVGRTVLTRISHRSPARLLPMRIPLAQAVGAAWCALGSHGGGLLGGDVVEVDVHVGAGATLALSTQSSTKVYRTRGPASEQRVRASVARGGLLLSVPDALVPFAESDFEQSVAVALEPGASAVLVDWLGAGRVANGERWAFRKLWSRTELHLVNTAEVSHGNSSSDALARATEPEAGWAHDDRLAELVESVCLDRPLERVEDTSSGARQFGFDLGNSAKTGFGSFATVVLAGPRVERAVEAFGAAALRLASQRARTRRPSPAAVGSAEEAESRALSAAVGTACNSLLEDVHVGVSRLTLRHEGTGGEAQAEDIEVAVVRLAAVRGEDLARVLHACLSPLSSQLGLAPYAAESILLRSR